MKEMNILDEQLAEFLVSCAEHGIRKQQILENVKIALDIMPDAQWEIMIKTFQQCKRMEDGEPYDQSKMPETASVIKEMMGND